MAGVGLLKVLNSIWQIRSTSWGDGFQEVNPRNHNEELMILGEKGASSISVLTLWKTVHVLLKSLTSQTRRQQRPWQQAWSGFSLSVASGKKWQLANGLKWWRWISIPRALLAMQGTIKWAKEWSHHKLQKITYSMENSACATEESHKSNPAVAAVVATAASLK